MPTAPAAKERLPLIINGFATGMVLQVAIGPVFFFILNIALQRTVMDGMAAVAAVTIVDYLFIGLAVMGVGRLLEKPRWKAVLGVVGSIVLILFGAVIALSVQDVETGNLADVAVASDYFASFMTTFALTIASPLTIVFWTGLFAAKAVEKGYDKKELILFGIAAGAATFIFLGISVLFFSLFRASIPTMALTIVNIGVGLLLMGYGVVRLVAVVRGLGSED